MKSNDKPWMKSNPSKRTPAKQDFIPPRWISPVEDGSDCAILRFEHHAIAEIFLLIMEELLRLILRLAGKIHSELSEG